MQRREDFTDMALGLVSVQSFPAIVGIADHMLKSSGVTLVGYEKIGSGYCTAIVRGNVADVRLAVSEGVERGRQFGQTVSDLTIARPMANLEAVLPIGSRLLQLATGRGHSRLSSQAVGLLETRGFPAMVGAADAMLKSADVVLAAYEMIGSGLCTVIIRGSVSNVGIALDVGMLEAERIGELHSVMLVPRPLDDLDQTLPLASCWIEESKPLQLPLSIKDKAEEPLALPLQQPRQEQRVMANEPLQLEGRPEFRPEFLREPRREYEEPPVVPGPAYVPTETAPLVSTDAAPHVSIEVAPTPIPDPSLEAPSPSGAPAPSPQPPLEKRPGKSKRKTPVRRPLDISEL